MNDRLAVNEELLKRFLRVFCSFVLQVLSCHVEYQHEEATDLYIAYHEAERESSTLLQPSHVVKLAVSLLEFL